LYKTAIYTLVDDGIIHQNSKYQQGDITQNDMSVYS